MRQSIVTMAESGITFRLWGSTSTIVAIKLANAQPLVVYLWSFFPALVTVISISGGHQMVAKSGGFGLVVLWGGVVALAVYSFITYRIVARH